MSVARVKVTTQCTDNNPLLTVNLPSVGGYITLTPLVAEQFTPIPFAPIAFFSLSFSSNVLCSGTHPDLICTTFVKMAVQNSLLYITDLALALIMWRVFSKSSVNRYTPLSARLKLFRKVTEAILQSAAIYSMASVTLIATLFISVDIGFVVCIGVFPSLIVSIHSFQCFHSNVLTRGAAKGLVFFFIVLRSRLYTSVYIFDA